MGLSSLSSNTLINQSQFQHTACSTSIFTPDGRVLNCLFSVYKSHPVCSHGNCGKCHSLTVLLNGLKPQLQHLKGKTCQSLCVACAVVK